MDQQLQSRAGALRLVFGLTASAWLLVAGNLLLGGHVDVAVRDVVMSVAAFTLARVLELRSEVLAPTVADGHRHVLAQG